MLRTLFHINVETQNTRNLLGPFQKLLEFFPNPKAKFIFFFSNKTQASNSNSNF